MTTTDPASLSISGPADLLAAVPHLLGFHPTDSLVIIGLTGGRLLVTARMDLGQTSDADQLGGTLAALARGGATQIAGAVYPSTEAGVTAQPTSSVVARLRLEAGQYGLEVLDVFVVAGDRWRSALCQDTRCCPPAGNMLPTCTAFTTASIVEGTVVAPTRAAMSQRFTPEPSRIVAQELLDAAEHATATAMIEGRLARHDSVITRSILASAQAARTARYPSDADVAGFGAALRRTTVRDVLWLAVDDGLDAAAFWLNLAQRLPSPYDAPALFLYGWGMWRAGNGALAGMAAERVLASAGDYSAAGLLLEALAGGVNPRQIPALRRSDGGDAPATS